MICLSWCIRFASSHSVIERWPAVQRAEFGGYVVRRDLVLLSCSKCISFALSHKLASRIFDFAQALLTGCPNFLSSPLLCCLSTLLCVWNVEAFVFSFFASGTRKPISPNWADSRRTRPGLKSAALGRIGKTLGIPTAVLSAPRADVLYTAPSLPRASGC